LCAVARGLGENAPLSASNYLKDGTHRVDVRDAPISRELRTSKSQRQPSNLPGGMRQTDYTALQTDPVNGVIGTEQADGTLSGQLFGPGGNTTLEY